MKYFLLLGNKSESQIYFQVWIDYESGLPLKRSIVPYRDGKPVDPTIYETYVGLKLDEKISDELFAPPPEEPEKKKKK